MKKMGISLLVLAFLVTVLSGCTLSLDTLGGTTLQYENAASYQTGGTSVSGDILKLDIHWVNGKVTIAYHDGEEILVSETSKTELSPSDSLHYRVAEGTLIVQYAKSGVMIDVALSKELTILIPREQKNGDLTMLRSLDVETVNADVLVEEIAVSACEFENISGKLTASFGRELYELSLETVSGDAEITANYIEKAEIESVSGDVTLRAGISSAYTPLRELEVQTVSGNVNLLLPAAASLSLEMESVSGAFDSELPFQKMGERYVIGSGEADIHVETVSGSVKIQKIN